MNWNQQRKIPFYFPRSVCLLALHVVVAPQKDFFFQAPSHCRQETSWAGGGGVGATAAENCYSVSASGSEGGGDCWPRGAKLCADMSFTPTPLDFVINA